MGAPAAQSKHRQTPVYHFHLHAECSITFFFLFRQTNDPLVADNTHSVFACNTHSFQVTVRRVRCLHSLCSLCHEKCLIEVKKE